MYHLSTMYACADLCACVYLNMLGFGGVAVHCCTALKLLSINAH
jgi:hypothetical protein